MKRNFLPFCLLLASLLSCNDNKDAIEPTIAESSKQAREAAVGAVAVGTTTHTGSGFTLTFINKASNFSSDTKSKMIAYFFNVYPKEVNRFNSKASKTVTFVIDPGYTGAAEASGPKITYSSAYLKSHPDDIDVVTHETMHVVQSYTGSRPSWLVEGVADYARYKYGVSNTEWSLPGYESGQKYTDAYRITAGFLVWCEKNVKSAIVDALDDKMRAGTYSSTSWEEITGSTVDELWSRYASQDRLKKGQTLDRGEFLMSRNGKFKLIMQTDGNLVLYKIGTAIALWSSGTFGKPVIKCAMQADGNLVLYDKNNKAYWSTSTYMYAGGFFVVQDDGNLVVYQNGIARWHRW